MAGYTAALHWLVHRPRAACSCKTVRQTADELLVLLNHRRGTRVLITIVTHHANYCGADLQSHWSTFTFRMRATMVTTFTYPPTTIYFSDAVA